MPGRSASPRTQPQEKPADPVADLPDPADEATWQSAPPEHPGYIGQQHDDEDHTLTAAVARLKD